MTIEWESTIIAAMATRQGVRDVNADGAAIHRVPGTKVVGAAIVDGIGSDAEVARFADIAAEVAARVGARKTAVLGILAAAELVAAPAGRGITGPDGVAVLAVAEPGAPTSIAWTGDSRAYGWNGSTLQQRTTDHNVGQYLRQNSGGGPVELLEQMEFLARKHDNWLRSSLGLCGIGSVDACHIPPGELALLASDGLHNSVPHEVMEALIREHEGHPQRLADALVAAATEDEKGYRDDATAIVLAPR
ncbi:PP2C family protein-serine/threonine phosphatase [Streptomyces olivoreticuli]|uniref:PP2C family protein-serine/threonine phosphatase n=1 Tax=Streptomyces olivoreticuli TaxID=68246 RepID=UPI000E24F01C|nr:SpoIIE family protein phosphatase [Streptomyces olivoreticuli]